MVVGFLVFILGVRENLFFVFVFLVERYNVNVSKIMIGFEVGRVD